MVNLMRHGLEEIKVSGWSPSVGLYVYTRKCVHVTGLSSNICVWMPCQSGCVYVSDSPLISSFLQSLFEESVCCVTSLFGISGNSRSMVIFCSCKSNISEMFDFLSVSQEIYWVLICSGCCWWAETPEQLREETLVCMDFPPQGHDYECLVKLTASLDF